MHSIAPTCTARQIDIGGCTDPDCPICHGAAGNGGNGSGGNGNGSAK